MLAVRGCGPRLSPWVLTQPSLSESYGIRPRHVKFNIIKNHKITTEFKMEMAFLVLLC